jgi:hypothetical protein
MGSQIFGMSMRSEADVSIAGAINATSMLLTIFHSGQAVAKNRTDRLRVSCSMIRFTVGLRSRRLIQMMDFRMMIHRSNLSEQQLT